MGQCAPYNYCGSSFSHEVKNHDAVSHVVTKQHLEEGLARFNQLGTISAQSVKNGPEAWKSAFSIASALLRGLYRHIPRVVRSVEFAEGSDCTPHFSKLPSEGKDVLATLCVKLSQKEVYGEIATRSRLGCYLRLKEEVIFSIHQMPANLSESPLVMELYGFDFVSLPEIVRFRQHLKQVLGPDYSKKSAVEWYEKHKNDFLPLKESKFRRIMASVFEVGMHASMLLPEWAVGRALWGTLNITTRAYDRFEFWDEGWNGIRVTVRGETLTDPEAVECLQNTRDLFEMQSTNAADRRICEKFSSSAFNVGLMSFGRGLGHSGAKPAVIAKLFSAAKRWGPGRSGWQSYDDTWECTDKKDHLGNVIEEQGRVIWITPGAGQIPSTPRQREDLMSTEVDGLDSESGDPKTWLLPTLLVLAVLLLLMSILSSSSKAWPPPDSYIS